MSINFRNVIFEEHNFLFLAPETKMDIRTIYEKSLCWNMFRGVFQNQRRFQWNWSLFKFDQKFF